MSQTHQNATVDLPEAPSALDLPNSPQPASHVASDDLPWVEQAPGIEMKILRVSDDAGTWVVMNRFQPGTTLPTHRHSGGVTAYTIAGKWRYLEHDFVAGPGSVIREPACGTHTLSVDADAKEATLVFFVIEGSLLHIGPDGEMWGISDAQTELARYLELAEAQGKPIDRSMIMS